MSVYYVGDQELETLKQALREKVKDLIEAHRRIENDHNTNTRVKALEAKRVRHVQTIARLRKTLAGAMKGIWRLRQKRKVDRIEEICLRAEVSILQAEVERLKEYERMYRGLSK